MHQSVFAVLKSLPDSLSLLYGTKLHEETGTRTKYSFFHQTIQELFAAIQCQGCLLMINWTISKTFMATKGFMQ